MNITVSPNAPSREVLYSTYTEVHKDINKIVEPRISGYIESGLPEAFLNGATLAYDTSVGETKSEKSHTEIKLVDLGGRGFQIEHSGLNGNSAHVELLHPKFAFSILVQEDRELERLARNIQDAKYIAKILKSSYRTFEGLSLSRNLPPNR